MSRLETLLPPQWLRHSPSVRRVVMRVHREEEAVEVGDLYRQHARFVWRAAASLGAHEDDREDVVHHVFEIVHRKLGELRPDVAPTTWLFGITRNVVSNHRRKQQRRATKHGTIAQEVSSISSPERHHDRAQRAALVAEFLEGLPAEQRVAFELVEIGGMSGPEVADAVGVNVNTVYTRLRSARAAFRSHVEQLLAEGAVG